MNVDADADKDKDAIVRTTVSDAEGSAPSEPRWRQRLVLTNFYAANFSVVFPIPSLDLALFIGRSVGRLAFGYQGTFSVGPADVFALAVVPRSPDAPDDGTYESVFLAPPILYHRHHLTMAGLGGRRGRIFYSLGGGPWWVYTELAGAEAEARVGYRFRVRAGRRRSGVVGGQLRLSGAFGGVPLPTLGLFVGFAVF